MPSNLREVNLELGRPFVAEAIRRLTFELHQSKRMGIKVLKIIHGYGSTGTGGKIRGAARRQLERMQTEGQVQGFIIGEQFSIFNEPSRKLLQLCPALQQDHDLDRYNNGVTFILL